MRELLFKAIYVHGGEYESVYYGVRQEPIEPSRRHVEIVRDLQFTGIIIDNKKLFEEDLIKIHSPIPYFVYVFFENGGFKITKEIYFKNDMFKIDEKIYIGDFIKRIDGIYDLSIEGSKYEH